MSVHRTSLVFFNTTPTPMCTGSHTVLVLLENGAKVTMIDNLSNSFLRVLDHMKRLAGDKAAGMKFEQVGVDCLSRQVQLAPYVGCYVWHVHANGQCS